MPDTAIPYDQDWYAWTQNQAALLRAWPEALRPNGLDLANLAEEVADMGASQRRAVESRLRLIALHLLKLEFHPSVSHHGHWRAEITEFRTRLRADYRDSPSLRARREAMAADIWPDAVQQARANLMDDAPGRIALLDAETDAKAPRYAIDGEWLNPDWFPKPFLD